MAKDDDTPKKPAKSGVEQKKAPVSKESGGAKKAAPPVVVQFDNEIQIFCDKLLPVYNAGENKAYYAVSKRKSGEGLYAIVCEKDMIPRRQAASVYSVLINPSLVPLVAYGKVYWSPAKEERYVFIYRSNLGRPLLLPSDAPVIGWKQDMVMDAVVKPMVNILQDFRDKDFFHGAIRPCNMFDGGSRDPIKAVILGDCLSTSPSFTQPVLYETIERGMSDPISRGRGVLSDDLYSFGVALAVFMRTQDPLAGLSDQEILQEKITHGSYAAITGKDRFKGSILELLRGLLHDDPSQRWTVDEVLLWMDGQRLSPKQAVKKKKAARPLNFNNDKYFQAPLLAMSLAVAPGDVVRVIDDNSLEQWLERSLEDDLALSRMQQAVQSSSEGGRGGGYQDRLTANLSCALDPMAPMRFRGLSLMGDGLGSALYQAMVQKGDIRVFADIFMQSIALNWVTMSENSNLDVTGLIGKFDSCRNSLRQSKIGYGIERCLYLLAPEAPCLSEQLKGYYVHSPEAMMFVFEDLCKKGKAPNRFLDRHSIAFLSAKDSKLIDSYLFDLNSAEDHRKILGALKCFATIQKRSKMQKFPEIGKVFLKMLPIVLKRFHDRQIREKIETGIEKFAKEGDLVKVAGLLDSPEVTQKDFKGFRLAMVEYGELRQEHKKLEAQLENEKTFGRATGKEFAALLSGGLAALLIAVTSFMFLSGRSIF